MGCMRWRAVFSWRPLRSSVWPRMGKKNEWKLFPPGTPKWPVTMNKSFSRYEFSVLWRLCWIPRSTRTQARFAAAKARATRSTSERGTSARLTKSSTGMVRNAASTASNPVHRWARKARSWSPSRTMMASIAAIKNASVPGQSWRCTSAERAVSVRRGSTTTLSRFGSFFRARSVSRALGMPWAWNGLVPMNKTTSACSMSSVKWQR